MPLIFDFDFDFGFHMIFSGNIFKLIQRTDFVAWIIKRRERGQSFTLVVARHKGNDPVGEEEHEDSDEVKYLVVAADAFDVENPNDEVEESAAQGDVVHGNVAKGGAAVFD